MPAELRTKWDDRLYRGRAAVHLLRGQATIDRVETLSKIVWQARPNDPEQFTESTEALRAFTQAVRREPAGR